MVGDNKPSPDKIETLAAMLGVSGQWLRYGIAEARPAHKASSLATATNQVAPTTTELEFLSRYRLLSEHQQNLISDLVEQLGLDRQMWGDA